MPFPPHILPNFMFNTPAEEIFMGHRDGTRDRRDPGPVCSVLMYFLASIESPSYGGSYVSPMALLDMIIVACTHYRPNRTLRLLKEADREQRGGSRWYGQDK